MLGEQVIFVLLVPEQAALAVTQENRCGVAHLGHVFRPVRAAVAAAAAPHTMLSSAAAPADIGPLEPCTLGLELVWNGSALAFPQLPSPIQPHSRRCLEKQMYGCSVVPHLALILPP